MSFVDYVAWREIRGIRSEEGISINIGILSSTVILQDVQMAILGLLEEYLTWRAV